MSAAVARTVAANTVAVGAYHDAVSAVAVADPYLNADARVLLMFLLLSCS